MVILSFEGLTTGNGKSSNLTIGCQHQSSWNPFAVNR